MTPALQPSASMATHNLVVPLIIACIEMIVISLPIEYHYAFDGFNNVKQLEILLSKED